MKANVNFDLESELKAHLNYFIQQNNLPADFLLKQNPQIDREFEVSEKSWIARATPKVPAKVIVKASVRYWEDSTINGIEDSGYESIPEHLKLYFFRQRKGFHVTMHINVTKEDEPRIKEYLIQKSKNLKATWFPILNSDEEIKAGKRLEVK